MDIWSEKGVILKKLNWDSCTGRPIWWIVGWFENKIVMSNNGIGWVFIEINVLGWKDSICIYFNNFWILGIIEYVIYVWDICVRMMDMYMVYELID